MKKLLFFVAAATLVFALSFCTKDEPAALYEVSVKVIYPEGYSDDDISNISVKMVNILTTRTDTARTDADGVAILKLEEGSYSVLATYRNDEFAFNGALENVNINSGNLDLEVELDAVSLKGGLIFKELYYSGSTTPELKKYYADQFHEIYNNSDEVIYLDGLCISILEPVSASPSIWVNNDGSLSDKLPMLFHTMMWPGTGQDYPLAPRTSIVVAQDGINHKSDPAGNPDSPVDLGNADWEVYVASSNKDTDSPAVPNLTIIYTTSVGMTDWLANVRGSAIILFRLPTGLDYESFVSNPENFKTKPGSSSSTQYLMVDKSWVIDAVEEVYPDPTQQYKRLPSSLDAGKVFCSGSYVGKSIRRKVDKIIDGKVIYLDTNNSTVDFLADQDPTPFVQPTVVDAID
jgi:hypothetical protein